MKTFAILHLEHFATAMWVVRTAGRIVGHGQWTTLTTATVDMKHKARGCVDAVMPKEPKEDQRRPNGSFLT